jgi:hypothetical protein
MQNGRENYINNAEQIGNRELILIIKSALIFMI